MAKHGKKFTAAAAQVQDPTLSHLPRMLAVIAALVVAGPWMGHQIAGFAERAFTSVQRSGH